MSFIYVLLIICGPEPVRADTPEWYSDWREEWTPRRNQLASLIADVVSGETATPSERVEARQSVAKYFSRLDERLYLYEPPDRAEILDYVVRGAIERIAEVSSTSGRSVFLMVRPLARPPTDSEFMRGLKRRPRLYPALIGGTLLGLTTAGNYIAVTSPWPELYPIVNLIGGTGAVVATTLLWGILPLQSQSVGAYFADCDRRLGETQAITSNAEVTLP